MSESEKRYGVGRGFFQCGDGWREGDDALQSFCFLTPDALGIEEPGVGTVDQDWAFHSEWELGCILFFSSSSFPQEKAAGNLGARL